MGKLALVRRGAIALSVAASLAAAPAAFASGGSGGGGGGSTAPAPSSSCAKITSFSNTTSNNWGNLARIDTDYTISSACSNWVYADATYTNQLTGAVDEETSAVIPVGTTPVTGAFVGAPLPFSTPYKVTLSVIDPSFNKLASTSASITTRKPQQIDTTP